MVRQAHHERHNSIALLVSVCLLIVAFNRTVECADEEAHHSRLMGFASSAYSTALTVFIKVVSGKLPYSLFIEGAHDVRRPPRSRRRRMFCLCLQLHRRLRQNIRLTKRRRVIVEPEAMRAPAKYPPRRRRRTARAAEGMVVVNFSLQKSEGTHLGYREK